MDVLYLQTTCAALQNTNPVNGSNLAEPHCCWSPERGAYLLCAAATCMYVYMMMKCPPSHLASRYVQCFTFYTEGFSLLNEHDLIIWLRQVAKMTELSTDGKAPSKFLRNAPCGTRILLDLFR